MTPPRPAADLHHSCATCVCRRGTGPAPTCVAAGSDKPRRLTSAAGPACERWQPWAGTVARP